MTSPTNFNSRVTTASYTHDGYQEQLNTLAKSTNLIVKENGTLARANLFEVIWENIKQLFGAKNWTNNTLVKYEVIQFLAKGKEGWINENNIKAVEELAKKVGLIESKNFKANEDDIRSIFQKNIDQKALGKKDLKVLKDKFFKEHKKDLEPYLQKINDYYQKNPTFSVKKQEGERATDHQETDSENGTTFSQDEEAPDDQFQPKHEPIPASSIEGNASSLIIPASISQASTPASIILSETQENKLPIEKELPQQNKLSNVDEEVTEKTPS